MSKVKIVKSQIRSEIESGMTRVELATQYGLSVGQINKALKQLGLDKMRAKIVKFDVEDDEVQELQSEDQSVYTTSYVSEANFNGLLSK